MHAQHTLKQLGYTEHEALAYVTLLQHSGLTGYALAKESGIPRANIYKVLEKLEARGAIQQHHGSGATTWVAVSSEVLLDSIASAHHQYVTEARQALDQIKAKTPADAVFNLDGDAIMKRAAQLVGSAREQLVIALQPNEAAQLKYELKQAQERGVIVTTLCLENCAVECGGCQGDLYRFALEPLQRERWLLISVDQSATLAASFKAYRAEGVYTRQALLVKLVTTYIWQSIALASLNRDMDACQETFLSRQTDKLLHALFADSGA